MAGLPPVRERERLVLWGKNVLLLWGLRVSNNSTKGMTSFSNQLFFFKGPHPQHMEIPRLGVESELQLPAYTTNTAKELGSEPRLRPTLQLTATPDP